MKIRLHEIPCHQRLELGNELVRSSVSGLAIRSALERPDDDPDAGRGVAELKLYSEGNSVFVRGSVDGWVEVACCRCVGTVRVPIQERITATFLPRNQVPEDLVDDADEVQVTEDDVDLYPYDGDEVDLEPLLREQVILAIPYAPVCREDCKGLCPRCGTDLNTNRCDCPPDIDPRLAALRDLKV